MQKIIRNIGKMQFRWPLLRRPINYIANMIVSRGPGRIKYGIGAGLMIDARGCNPGFLFGTSEPAEQRALAGVLSSGNVFYDLGANAGFYCLIAARLVGESGLVFGFEPTPTLAERIRENARLNGFANVSVIEAAVCEESGIINFGVHGETNVQNSILAASSKDARCVTVSCISIDDFTSTHPAPDVMMIDIEGSEIDALMGAINTIRLFRPTILVEVHWLGSAFTSFVEEHLAPLGYVATTYDGASLPSTPCRFHCLLKAVR